VTASTAAARETAAGSHESSAAGDGTTANRTGRRTRRRDAAYEVGSTRNDGLDRGLLNRRHPGDFAKANHLRLGNELTERLHGNESSQKRDEE
jgi:hypothetical protein